MNMPFRPSGTPTRSLAVGLFASSLLLAACGGDDGSPTLVDDDDGGGTTTVATSGGPASSGGDEVGADESSTGFFPICTPGDLRCAADGSGVEICAGTGLSWEVEVMCGTYSECQPCDENDNDCSAPLCIGPCQLSINDPSSAGCAFVANRQLHRYGEAPDGLVITNPSPDLDAAVQVFEVPEGLLEESLLESFTLAPNSSQVLELSSDFVPGLGTNLRTGGVFRVYSDTPVISYLHAPLQANRGNESSLLLPDQVLGTDYVVTSYTSRSLNDVGVSYFEIVALEDETRVEWTPSVDTAGNGLPINPVAAGETGEIVLNRYETMRIVPSVLNLPKENPEAGRLDLSGTYVHSDKPIWITGANRMSEVPYAAATADQLQELLFPLQHWGQSYVLPSARPRGDIMMTPDQPQNYWRIYAGRAGVVINSDPPHPDFPIELENVGDYVEVLTDHGQHLHATANGPFMPVLYTRSRILEVEKGVTNVLPYGDPAMVQMVPTEQFLSRYVFATGVGFAHNAVQFIRPVGGADITLVTEASKSITVDDFEQVGEFEIAAVDPLGSGTFVATSDSPFGIIQSGHTSGLPNDLDCFDQKTECNGTYAYPGGMKAETIFIP